MYTERIGRAARETREVKIYVEINLDGKSYRVRTPYRFFTHILETMAHHGGIGLSVEAEGDMSHHVIEDTGIALGEALAIALGDRRGIKRFGYALIPMDDALVAVAIDLARRPYSSISLGLRGSYIEDIDGSLIEHFLRSMSSSGYFTMHAVKLAGEDPHHIAEACFKALGVSLSQASSRSSGEIISVKGVA
ncbi:MAG: imidazoleglycerol-phosphate dehydratase [Desulfurococcales archaeon]|jgi:imidazoleglycerol phosphate dehydratase HisB|nr:imidazoleglycerol-phosphate dehydratase [Desulfurococcales archaeon]